ARAAAASDQVRRRVDVPQLGSHVGAERVARTEALRELRGLALQPRPVAGGGLIPALMDDLRPLQQRGQDGADRPVDLVGALGAARDVDDGLSRVEAEEAAARLACAARRLRATRGCGD